MLGDSFEFNLFREYYLPDVYDMQEDLTYL